jgi:hypothetical protein
VLTVAEGVRIRKVRRFPLSGDVAVKAGDRIRPDTLIGRHSAEERLQVLRIEAADQKIQGVLVRQPGDEVKKGEAIALSTFAMGLGLTEYCSPVDGFIVTIDTVTGTVVIREHPEPLKSLLPGVVSEILWNEAVVIETVGAYIEGAYGAGFPNGGRLSVLAPTRDAVVNPAEITYRLAGRIVVVGAECRHEHLMAALRSRVTGLIAGGGDLEAITAFNDFVRSLDREEYEARFGGKPESLTEWEEDDYVPGVTVILTEGFGRLSVRHDVFDVLRAREGMYAFVDVPGSHSEYGEPPQVIIPDGEAGAGKAEAEAAALNRQVHSAVEPGSRVRLTGSARFGETGVVEGFCGEPLRLATGESVPGLAVRLDGGSTVSVPRTNIEVLGSG